MCDYVQPYRTLKVQSRRERFSAQIVEYAFTLMSTIFIGIECYNINSFMIVTMI